jgi:tryptophanyl-tRNA synthetase
MLYCFDDAMYLLDTPDRVRSKIIRATTDSQRGIRFDETGPGHYNLLTIHEILSAGSRFGIEGHFA